MPKILIADDNSNIQKMVALAFEDHKIEVIAVGNGEAAVKKLPDVKPDLILADVFMPVRNGYEVCEFVKKDARYSSIPVILLVGAFDPLDEAEAKRVAADGVLKKPFVPPDPLIALVTGLLSKTLKAAPAAKAKEASPAEPPQLMPRKPQADPVQPVTAYGESSADDDAYLVGKGRDADDDKWQTVTSSHQEAGAAGFESGAAKVFSGLAAETADDHFGETHAEARRRQEVDNQAVPSFSSALVGEMEEKSEDRSQEKRRVVPNPQAEAQPETNWAALVKSFTAAPLSISEPTPVKQSEEPALEHMIDQVSGAAEAKKFAADVAEPQVSAYVAEPGVESEPARAERVEAKSSSTAASSAGSSSGSSFGPSTSARAAAKAESSAKVEATRSYEEKNSVAETSAYGQETEIQSAVTVSPIQAKVLAQVEASVRAAEVNEKPAFDESLWAKMAMQTSLPAEPPLEEYESRSNTAAQMIAAAAEAAQEYSQRGSGFPFLAQGESQAAQATAQATAVKTAPAKIEAQVEAPAVVESAAAVGYAEVMPSPREVPHVFKADGEEKASAAAAEAVVEAPVEKAEAPEVEAAPVAATTPDAVSNASGTDGESTRAEVQAAQEVEAQQAVQAAIPPNVDEIVARVLERIAPQLQELISKGVIKPLVEEAMRQPESPKKK